MTGSLDLFLSTPSARRATRNAAVVQGDADISIHALRKEGDIRFSLISSPPQISIHALRKEGDRRGCWYVDCRCISIHALREEGDVHLSPDQITQMIFLSTPSARRATRSPLIIFTAIGNFYPRPPRGGRPCCQGRQALHQDISIHALREEGDSSSPGT